jgi:predicted PurR-regulated permease PerM
MEIVYFTVIAIGLYAVSDALLRWLERRRGAPFENRQVVFFAIILPLALITFWLLQTFAPGAGS